MLENCDVFIYNTHLPDNPTNIEEEKLKIKRDIEFGVSLFEKDPTEPKLLILVSDILSWSNTEKKIKEEKKEVKEGD